jgi:hypothetical protein
MSQVLVPIDLPIRLQCLRVPISWKLETADSPGIGRSLFVPKRGEPGSEKVSRGSYDAWDTRNKLFQLKENDNHAAVEFLNSVGLFETPDIGIALGMEVMKRGTKEDLINTMMRLLRDFQYVEGIDGKHRVKPWATFPVPVQMFWDFRRLMLGEMKRKVSPDFAQWDYKLRFAALIRLGPSAVITTTALKDAVAASIRIDQLRGAKFLICKRPDCAIPFAAIGPRKRKFHDPYCGHITLIRKQRKAAKKGRKP